MDTAHKDITADGEEEKHTDRRGERCAAASFGECRGEEMHKEGRRGSKENRGEEGWMKVTEGRDGEI